jgi:hypothetical protein
MFIISCVHSWKELGDSLRFHVELAKESNAPSEFRLLNALAPKIVGDPNADPDFSNVRALNKIFDGGPSGGTPLCRHINDVVNYLRHHEQEFRQNGQVASLVICTDGVSSDGDVTVAMRPLKQLPVMIVVRLCTDSDDVVAYWDRVEKDLEMDLDIIDDFFGEGKGVYEHNPWINYGEPLQRLREFGVKVKELDMIDEKLLTVQQMQKFLGYLFNCRSQDVPDPQFDWATFETWVANQLKALPLTYNPNSTSTGVEPWIDMRKLRACYHPNDGGCCSIN